MVSVLFIIFPTTSRKIPFWLIYNDSRNKCWLVWKSFKESHVPIRSLESLRFHMWSILFMSISIHSVFQRCSVWSLPSESMNLQSHASGPCVSFTSMMSSITFPFCRHERVRRWDMNRREVLRSRLYLVIRHLLQIEMCGVDQVHSCVAVICASESAPAARFGNEAVVFFSTTLRKIAYITSQNYSLSVTKTVCV